MAIIKKNKPAENPEGAAVTPGTVVTPEPAAQAAPEPAAQAAPEPAAQAAPEPAAVPAVAQQAGAPAVVSAKAIMSHMVFGELENAFIAEFGMLPRMLANNGNIMDGDNKILGTWITGQVLSWNRRWTITPAQDGAPDNLVRFSMDNKVLDDDSGQTVIEAIAELKAAGYPNACSKEYYDVVFSLHSSEKPSDHVGGMVSIQLSPTSRKDFDAFRLQTTYRQQTADLVKVSVTPVTGKNNKTWTKFVWSVI